MLKNRYRRVTFFFAQILGGLALWEILLPRLGLRKWVEASRSRRLQRSARQFRLLAIQMGGVLIKIGQFFSSRVDVLPEEITTELSGLQDEVPPEKFTAIRSVAEAEFGHPLGELFALFDEEPLAAASLGQVHHARIRLSSHPNHNHGTQILAGQDSCQNDLDRFQDVVVKIQRPQIETIISTDLAALRTVGRWIQRYPPVRRRADVPALLGEFSRILYEEIDYLAEGRNAEIFAAHFQDRPEIRVPGVIWTHTTRRVLTLEDVGAIKITDYPAIEKAGVSLKDVAFRLLDTYLKQIFEDGFFHADPHPGNLFVYPFESDRGREWQLTFVDFGMVGHVSPNLMEGLRQLLVAVGTRDAARAVQSYVKLGFLLPSADLELLEKAEATIFDRFWGKNMSELREISPEEIFELSKEYRQLIFNLPFQIPHDLILLGRTVGILSGMCTGLDPKFNVWEALVPYAQKLVSEELSKEPRFILEEILKYLRIVVMLPRRADALLDKVERGELQFHDRRLAEQVQRLRKSIHRIGGGVVFALFSLGAAQLFLAGNPIPAAVFGVAGLFFLVWFSIRES